VYRIEWLKSLSFKSSDKVHHFSFSWIFLRPASKHSHFTILGRVISVIYHECQNETCTSPGHCFRQHANNLSTCYQASSFFLSVVGVAAKLLSVRDIAEMQLYHIFVTCCGRLINSDWKVQSIFWSYFSCQVSIKIAIKDFFEGYNTIMQMHC